MAKLLVCLNSSCTSLGAGAIVRDIEDLSHGQCDVEEWGCLGKCGKGPNVEVQDGGSKQLKTNVKSFKKAVELVEEVGCSVSSKASKVGKIKYALRRESDASKKMTLLDEAFQVLGGETNKSEPILLASLLILRSQIYLKDKMGSALKDAEAAASLVPGWAQANLAFANALEACARSAEGVKVMETALQIGKGLNLGVNKRAMKRMERKAQEEADNPEDTEARRKKAMETVAKPKAAAKGKAKAKAKPDEGKGKAKARAKSKDDKAVATKKDVKTEAKAADVVPEAKSAADDTGGPTDWIDWKIEQIDKLNHDCIRMLFKTTEAQSVENHKFPNEDVWHVDFLKEDGENVMRSYTPISTSTQYKAGTLEFMIKIYPEGKMTKWLSTLKVGDLLPISSPLPTSKPQDYVDGIFMVAGGSAVTVAIQLCQAVLKLNPAAPVQVAMCNRDFEDVLYNEIFEDMMTRHSTFDAVHCISRGALPDPLPKGRVGWKKGRLSKQVLQPAVGSSMKGVVSGPMGLCRTTMDTWLALGLPESSFDSIDEMAPPQAASGSDSAADDGSILRYAEPEAPPAMVEMDTADESKPLIEVLEPTMNPVPPEPERRGWFCFLCTAPPLTQASVDGEGGDKNGGTVGDEP